MASTVHSNAIESCRLASVTVTASGIPRASTTMCRFDPSLPGLSGWRRFPAPGGWKRWPHQGLLAPNQPGRAHAVGAALPDATGPIRLQRRMPVCKTHRMPCSAARSSTVRRRPSLVDGVNAGISGSSAAHNSLLIFRLAMPPWIWRIRLDGQVVLATLSHRTSVADPEQPVKLLKSGQSNRYRRARAASIYGEIVPYVTCSKGAGFADRGVPAWISASASLNAYISAVPPSNRPLRGIFVACRLIQRSRDAQNRLVGSASEPFECRAPLHSIEEIAMASGCACERSCTFSQSIPGCPAPKNGCFGSAPWRCSVHPAQGSSITPRQSPYVAGISGSGPLGTCQRQFRPACKCTGRDARHFPAVTD